MRPLLSDWDAETLNSYIGTEASNVLVRTQLPDVLARNGSLPSLVYLMRFQQNLRGHSFCLHLYGFCT